MSYRHLSDCDSYVSLRNIEHGIHGWSNIGIHDMYQFTIYTTESQYIFFRVHVPIDNSRVVVGQNREIGEKQTIRYVYVHPKYSQEIGPPDMPKRGPKKYDLAIIELMNEQPDVVPLPLLQDFKSKDSIFAMAVGFGMTLEGWYFNFQSQ